MPSLSRLGGTDWANTKNHVREAVQQVAEDLLNLYARRQTAKGYAFQPDTPWQTELEDSFPYVETPDQKQRLPPLKKIWRHRARWTACYAATWATQDRSGPCARPSRL